MHYTYLKYKFLTYKKKIYINYQTIKKKKLTYPSKLNFSI